MNEIRIKVVELLNEIIGFKILPEDYNENLLGLKINVSSVELAYFMLRLETAYNFRITDKFIEKLSIPSINNLSKIIKETYVN